MTGRGGRGRDGTTLQPPAIGSEDRCCANCGRPSKRLGRAPGLGFAEPVCQSCRAQADGFGTCTRCRRYRKIVPDDAGGARLCGACTGENPTTHPCRRCGEPVPGAGAGACRGCLAKEAIARSAGRTMAMLKQPWLRQLFGRFAAWGGLPAAVGLQPARMERYGLFFKVLDARIEGQGALSQAALIDLFGVEGLRRRHVPVSFLVRETGIAWHAALLDEAAEQRRVSKYRDAWAGCPYAEEMDDYLDALSRRAKPLATKTLRVYLNAATRLAKSAKVTSLGGIGQQHLDRFLRRNSGQRASLAAFAGYLRETFGVKLIIARPPVRSARTKERRQVRLVRSLLAALEPARGTELRALTAAAVSRVYGVPLTRVLTLKPGELRLVGASVVLWPDSDALETRGTIAAALLRCVESNGTSLLFPGRGAIKPITAASVVYYVGAGAGGRRDVHQGKINRRLQG